MMSTQNCCPPIRNEMSSRDFVGELFWVLVMASPCCAEPPVGERPVLPLRCNDRVDVENESDAAIAQNGRRGDSLDRAIICLHTLDHDLALAEDVFNQERCTPAHVVLDQKGHTLGRLQWFGPIAEQHAEINQGHEFAAKLN